MTPRPAASILGVWRGLETHHAAAALAVALGFGVTNLPLLLEAPGGSGTFLPAFLLHQAMMGVALVLAVTAADARVDAGAARWPSYAVAVGAACVICSLLSWHLVQALGWHDWFPADVALSVQRTQMLFGLLGLLLKGGFGTAAYVRWRETRLTARALRRSEVGRAHAARRLQETRLLTLQAQVDPQFLFATLSLVRALQRHDAAQADALLNELIALLRALMPQDRAGASTLADELTLAVSYLRVVASAVMALTIEIAVSAEAGVARLAPMLLVPWLKATLAAHAGGMPRLQLRADTAAGRLRITLSAPGHVGAPIRPEAPEWRDLRARLAELHGPDAMLVAEPGPDLATRIELPLET